MDELNKYGFLPTSVLKLRQTDKDLESPESVNKDVDLALFIFRYYGRGVKNIFDPRADGERGYIVKAIEKEYYGICNSEYERNNLALTFGITAYNRPFQIPKCDFCYTDFSSSYTLENITEIAKNLVSGAICVIKIKNSRNGMFYIDNGSKLVKDFTEFNKGDYKFTFTDKVIVDKTPRKSSVKLIKEAEENFTTLLVHEELYVFRYGEFIQPIKEITPVADVSYADRFKSLISNKLKNDSSKKKGKLSSKENQKDHTVNMHGDTIVTEAGDTTITDIVGNSMLCLKDGTITLNLLNSNEPIIELGKITRMGAKTSIAYKGAEVKIINGSIWVHFVDKVFDYIDNLVAIFINIKNNDYVISKDHYDECRVFPNPKELGFNRKSSVLLSEFTSNDSETITI